MKNKLSLLLIPLLLIFVSCTDGELSGVFYSRVTTLSSDAKSYKCNQEITLTLSRTHDYMGEAGGVFSVYKKNANNGYDLYSDYEVISEEAEITKCDTSCIFLIDLENLENKNHFKFTIPDAGEYIITLSLFKSVYENLDEEQNYVCISVIL